MTGDLKSSLRERPWTFAGISAGVLIFATSSFAAEQTLRISMRADSDYATHAIARAKLPPSWRSAKHARLTSVETGQSIPVQLEKQTGSTDAYWLLASGLTKGETRIYKLTAEDAPAKNRVRVEDDGERLNVFVGAKRVLAYNQKLVKSPIKGEPYYARSGYIHPLFAPSGQMATDDFNPNHAHQHGIMMAWRKMQFEGRTTDDWDQKAGLGRVEHAEVAATQTGPVFGGFTAKIKHIDLTGRAPKTMLNETWRVRVFAIDEYFLFDIETRQTCATDRPVTIKKIHYSGMTIRGRADWNQHRSYDYLTDQGKTKANGNHSRPKWVAMHGPTPAGELGVTIMDHPNNFRYPQPVRLHPQMPYFCFAPCVQADFAIEPGKPFTSRYRFYVRDGKVAPETASQLWRQFAKPLTVTIAE